MINEKEFRTRTETRIVFDPIPITSPEQFVPLYVASLTPHYNRYSSLYIRGNVALSNPDTYDKVRDLLYEDGNIVEARKELKKDLLHILNHGIPKDYVFSIGLNYTGNSISRSTTILDVFNNGNEMCDYDCTTMTGLVLNKHRRSYTHIKRPIFYKDQFTTTLKVLPSGFMPLALIIVKAKHIPMLRAALYLEMKVEIPIPDIKLLVNSVDLPGTYELIRTKMYSYVSSSDLIMINTSSREMLKYLVPTIEHKEDVVTILKRAVSIANEARVNEYT